MLCNSDSEIIEYIAKELKECFKENISNNSAPFNDGVPIPFEQTGVSMPNDSVWERYATAALDAYKDATFEYSDE